MMDLQLDYTEGSLPGNDQKAKSSCEGPRLASIKTAHLLGRVLALTPLDSRAF